MRVSFELKRKKPVGARGNILLTFSFLQQIPDEKNFEIFFLLTKGSKRKSQKCTPSDFSLMLMCEVSAKSVHGFLTENFCHREFWGSKNFLACPT